jgi:uncharacterized protein YnzC (UPF0291/DUF896 family)
MNSNKKAAYSTSHRTTVLEIRENDPAAEAALAAQQAAIALQAKIDAAVEAATSGLKTKNAELLGKMKTTSDRLKLFGDIDPEKIKEIQNRLDHDEDIKAFSEGRKNEVIHKYTERMRADHLAQLEAERLLTKAEAARADTYKGSVLDNQIRQAAKGLHTAAVDDALLHARNIFSLDAKGNAVQLDTEGVPVLGKDGKSPFSPSEWFDLQKELKPHWFPMGTSGSGSSGVRDSSGTGKVIKRADFDNIPAHEKGAIIASGIKIID